MTDTSDVVSAITGELHKGQRVVVTSTACHGPHHGTVKITSQFPAGIVNVLLDPKQCPFLMCRCHQDRHGIDLAPSHVIPISTEKEPE